MYEGIGAFQPALLRIRCTPQIKLNVHFSNRVMIQTIQARHRIGECEGFVPLLCPRPNFRELMLYKGNTGTTAVRIPILSPAMLSLLRFY